MPGTSADVRHAMDRRSESARGTSSKHYHHGQRKERDRQPDRARAVSTGHLQAQPGPDLRQVTFVVLALAVLIGAWRLSLMLTDVGRNAQFLLPSAAAAVGIWLAFRLVNFPSFADFLIAVEAEMNKVSWPTRGELIRSSLVVIFCIFSLAAILFAYDAFWKTLLQLLRVVGK